MKLEYKLCNLMWFWCHFDCEFKVCGMKKYHFDMIIHDFT